jgi:hypothetical protein
MVTISVVLLYCNFGCHDIDFMVYNLNNTL